jgi:hypothetical protein
MMKESSEHSGYIVWLDFTRVENKEEYDILSRPSILPYIPNDEVKPDDPRCKKLIEAAKTIAAVAAKIVYECDHNLVNQNLNLRTSIMQATSDFEKKVVHKSEYNWYKERDTWDKVINVGMFKRY